MESCSMWSFEIDFSFNIMFSGFSTSFSIYAIASNSTSFLPLSNNIFLYTNITFVYPFITWWAFGLFQVFGLVLIMLLWTFMHRIWCGHMFLLLKSRYTGLDLMAFIIFFINLLFWNNLLEIENKYNMRYYVPSTQFSPMVTSCITVVHHQK